MILIAEDEPLVRLFNADVFDEASSGLGDRPAGAGFQQCLCTPPRARRS
jgi:phosphoribosyl-dephospho-CoA transferase